MTRRLTLRSESLAALTSDDLASVAGGALPTTPLAYCLDQYGPRTLDVRECVSNAHTCIDCLTRWC